MSVSRETARQALNLKMQPNDANAPTIRDYLIRLLSLVWEEGEGFNGKRPFGNSGWEYDLYVPLVRAGMIEGTFDHDGYPEDLDDILGDEIIAAAIQELGRVDS